MFYQSLGGHVKASPPINVTKAENTKCHSVLSIACGFNDGASWGCFVLLNNLATHNRRKSICQDNIAVSASLSTATHFPRLFNLFNNDRHIYP